MVSEQVNSSGVMSITATSLSTAELRARAASAADRAEMKILQLQLLSAVTELMLKLEQSHQEKEEVWHDLKKEDLDPGGVHSDLKFSARVDVPPILIQEVGVSVSSSVEETKPVRSSRKRLQHSRQQLLQRRFRHLRRRIRSRFVFHSLIIGGRRCVQKAVQRRGVRVQQQLRHSNDKVTCLIVCSALRVGDRQLRGNEKICIFKVLNWKFDLQSRIRNSLKSKCSKVKIFSKKSLLIVYSAELFFELSMSIMNMSFKSILPLRLCWDPGGLCVSLGTNVLVGSCLISVFLLFVEMLVNGFLSDRFTFPFVVNACANIADLRAVKQVHAEFIKIGNEIDVFLCHSLVHFYCECGGLEAVREVFDEMKDKDCSAWTITIGAMAMEENGVRAIELFNEMVKHGVEPDGVTFVVLLTACNHSGFVGQGKEFFELMSSKYNINPLLEHYGCMVDLLGRAGLLEEAKTLIKSMPEKPNYVIWSSLLAACKLHNNLDPIQKEKGVSIWSMIKDNVGKDLSRVCLLVYLNEPISSFHKCFEDMEYSHLLDQAYEYGKMGNSLMRILKVAAFDDSGYVSSEDRHYKPFNPLLGETYEADYTKRGIRFSSEKVSHHPMLIACYCAGKGWNSQEISVSNVEIGRNSEWYSSIADSHCEKVMVWGIVEVRKTCKNVKELKLSACLELKDFGLDIKLLKLELVGLGCCTKGIWDKCFSSISRTCESFFKKESSKQAHMGVIEHATSSTMILSSSLQLEKKLRDGILVSDVEDSRREMSFDLECLMDLDSSTIIIKNAYAECQHSYVFEEKMGNGKFGHNVLGAGRIYAQGAKLVDLALASREIYDGEGFNYIKECSETNTLHLMGLMSDGGVRSSFDQIQYLLKYMMAFEETHDGASHSESNNGDGENYIERVDMQEVGGTPRSLVRKTGASSALTKEHFESHEIKVLFDAMPQISHYREQFRSRMIMGIEQGFMFVAEQIGSLTDAKVFKCKMDSIKNELTYLETMGYDVSRFRTRLGKLS